MIRNINTAREEYSEIAAVLSIFNKITDIPRPSGKEERIRSFLIDFAEKPGRNWVHRTDEIGNLAIDIPATPGYETAPRVVLQGHMDMVCTRGKNDTRPTNALYRQGSIRAPRTTLGADNGMGMALALELGDNPNIVRGPLTLLFTVDEEVGVTGATQLDPNLVPADAVIMINLDAENGTDYVFGGAHGNADTTGKLPIRERESIPEGYRVIDIELKGLTGGHSGSGRAWKLTNPDNAIKKLAGLIRDFQAAHPEVRLVSFDGGEANNLIAQSARARIALPQALVKELKKIDIRAKSEHEKLEIQPAAETPESLQSETAQKILNVLSDLPFGALVMQPKPPFAMLSNNIGRAETGPDQFEVSTLTRGADMDQVKNTLFHIRNILEQSGFEVQSSEPLSSWVEPGESVALHLAREAIGEIVGKLPQVINIHAFLECGAVKSQLQKIERTELSTVSIGPSIKKAHEPGEEIDLRSLSDIREVVIYMLKIIAAPVVSLTVVEY